jgi:transposase InsO family protein
MMPAQAYQSFQSMTMSALLQAPSWDISRLVQALQAALIQQASNHGDWYMDSGASSHMIGDQLNLTHYSPSLLHDSSQIVVGNGHHLQNLGSDSTHLRAPNINFLLASVLHTLLLVSNLILVCKFTRDNWCSIEFDPFDFSVKDLTTKTPIMRSNSFSDLYPFVGFSKNHNNITLSTIVSSVDLWHHRLRHPSNVSLSHLLSKFHIPCTNNSSAPSVCEACHKGKHVRLPFPNSISVTYFPFQIIHCDLWTSPNESLTSFKYYLIVIDDFSRYIWTFPLHLKSDVANVICDFYRYVLNQFHLSIQIIQCDNGKEFDNQWLRSFFNSHGIVFRLSCPHTSPQNGKAERNIHTINDIMCTLLFQAHLKSCYWVESLHTATYLYNRRLCRPLYLCTPTNIYSFNNLIILICAHLVAYVSLILVPLHQINFLLGLLLACFLVILVNTKVIDV